MAIDYSMAPGGFVPPDRLVSTAHFELGGKMITLMICLILAILVLGWVLRTNAHDRKMFEKELEGDTLDGPRE